MNVGRGPQQGGRNHGGRRSWPAEMKPCLMLDFLFQAIGNAPTRAYHSCNLFHGELLVFGGVYPNPDPQPDSCSNELYIFDTNANNWYKPLTTGDPPSPKSG